MTSVIDYVEEAKYRDCCCGHSLLTHRVNGPCRGKRTERDYSGLPKADPTEDPFDWPANWPPIGSIPEVTKPCPCKNFADYEPEPDGAL